MLTGAAVINVIKHCQWARSLHTDRLDYLDWQHVAQLESR
jgi:hypothetical protein